MKQLLLFCCLSWLFMNTLYAQQPQIQFKDVSFKKMFTPKEPLVISTNKSTTKPSFQLPSMPDYMWKHHPETHSYYNNHRLNFLCFNQSNGWELIEVRPMKCTPGEIAAGIGGAIGLIILENIANSQ